MMSVLLLLVAVVAFFFAHSRFAPRLERLTDVHTRHITPAHSLRDNIDFVPTPAPILLGHHFSSIAGAGPIVGPILAAAYGWGPVALWIIVGAIFIGGTHDFMALLASVRHHGRSIGEVIQLSLGSLGRVLFLLFCWSALTLVIAIFAQFAAQTFVQSPGAASASILYLVLALAFGLLVYRFRLPFTRVTIAFLPLLALSIWLGFRFPVSFPPSGLSLFHLSLSPQTLWLLILAAYICVASIAPVWVLLQPRDYLSAFLLYALMIAGVLGILVARPALRLPIITSWNQPQLGSLFPALFVTVACGAVSGFHSLVASGTTAKQLNNEKDARIIGYGAMLIEAILAIVALITAAVLSQNDYAHLVKNPIAIFARGIASFLLTIGVPAHHGNTFAELAVSAFVLTTLDTATRLSRFCLQEICARRHPDGSLRASFLDRYSATFLCTAAALALALSGEAFVIWPVFGASNPVSYTHL
ncbi:MAG: carbon starvation protein A, partial [bacterium]|nr:carbon starvation protein A [bacterium]